MSDDERAIRSLIETWIAASQHGDLDTVLSLMADDIVFMTPGRDPFGKKVFAEAFGAMKGIVMTGVSEVKEIGIVGSWAWCRTHLAITVTPPGGKATRRSGYILSVLRKEPNGAWVIARDANLLAAE